MLPSPRVNAFNHQGRQLSVRATPSARSWTVSLFEGNEAAASVRYVVDADSIEAIPIDVVDRLVDVLRDGVCCGRVALCERKRSALPKGPNAYRAADLARRWNVSLGSIYRLARTGELRTLKLGKLIRIPAAEVERVEREVADRALLAPEGPTAPKSSNVWLPPRMPK